MHLSPDKTNKLSFFLIPLVWLFADPVFFVEYGGKSLLLKVPNGLKAPNGIIWPKVYLWELQIRECKFAEKHPEFEGVFVCNVSTQCGYSQFDTPLSARIYSTTIYALEFFLMDDVVSP